MDVLSVSITLDKREGVPVATFEDPTEIITGGDSGGGMFKDDQLIGNTWRGEPRRITIREDGEVIERRRAVTEIVALLPLNLQ